MVSKGKPVGWRPQSEADHYVRCPECGMLIDIRDLGQALDDLHGQEIEEEPEGGSMTCSICDDSGWFAKTTLTAPGKARARDCGGLTAGADVELGFRIVEMKRRSAARDIQDVSDLPTRTSPAPPMRGTPTRAGIARLHQRYDWA